MIRPQYHFRRVGPDIHIWDVRKLLVAAEMQPAQTWPLADIPEIDEPYWFELGGAEPTCRRIMEHAAQVADANLAYPILLCAKGRVMDGMHRVMKALTKGHATIAARKLEETPPPDFINRNAADLPY